MKVERYCPESPEFRVSISFGNEERIISLAEAYELLDGLAYVVFGIDGASHGLAIARHALANIEAHYAMWAAKARVRESFEDSDTDPVQACKENADATCAMSQAQQRINDTWAEMLEMHGRSK